MNCIHFRDLLKELSRNMVIFLIFDTNFDLRLEMIMVCRKRRIKLDIYDMYTCICIVELKLEKNPNKTMLIVLIVYNIIYIIF